MSCNRVRFFKPIVALGVFGLAVGLLAGLSALVSAKPDVWRSMGLVDDWTHRQVIFSNPGTLAEAVAQGRYEQWYKIVNNPRYIMQQMKRKSPLFGSSENARDYLTLSNRLAMPLEAHSFPTVKVPPPAASSTHRDWAFSLGTGTVAENMSPAKFTWNINATPNCTSDFAVYGLNVAGASGGQANLVALNNLYSSTNGTGYCAGTGPAVYWAYHATTTAAGVITTSPVLSYDGTKIIYVESGGTAGPYLHVLAWNSADGGTVAASKAPAHVLAAGTGVSGCTAGASCLVSILLNATTETVTNSSPFYDYNTDTVYVGDDAGNLYKVTPVIASGTPVVSKLNIVATGGVHDQVMTGPVYDPNSGYVFVGASNGVLYAVTARTLALQTTTVQVGALTTSCSGGYNNALVNPPIVDVSNGWVYEYTTDDPTLYTVVEQASTAGPFTTTNVVTVGQGDQTCGSSRTFPTHLPAFDNNYYYGAVTSGHMWVCGRESAGYSESALWMIPTSGTNGSISGVTATDDSTAIYEDEHAVCTPLTEIYSGSTDYLYLSEGITNNASGLGTNYTNFASFYGFTLSDTAGTATAIAGSPITEPTATGGSSGIVVDNMFTEPLWQASHAYSQDTLITDSKGNVEECVTAGTSGTAAPAWNTTVVAASTTLHAAITSTTATSVSVTSTTGFAVNDYILIGAEWMKISAIAGTTNGTFTVSRGQLGSTAATHANASTVATFGTTTDGTVTWINEGPNQTSSVYFTTLATSTTVCGTTAAYCAVKLTQGGLQ